MVFAQLVSVNNSQSVKFIENYGRKMPRNDLRGILRGVK